MHIHEQEKRQFKKLLMQQGIERLEDRFKVLKAFLKIESHVKVSDIVDILEQEGYNLEEGFVRDTIKLLCHFGFARKNRFDDGRVCYEHLHLGQHHDHMICIKCRKIIEFKNDDLEDLQLKVAEAHGFHMLQHRMEIYGICSNCSNSRLRLMPLTNAKPGEKVKIKNFTGGVKARLRFMSMGLRIGDEIEIVTSQNKGQVVVASDYKRYAFGRGLARKIMIETT